MGEKLFLGIDVGTGGTRAVAIDETGRVVAAATAEHEPFASPQTGWAEQHPEDWWRATQQAVRAVLAKGVSADRIASVGFSGQMHGSVLLDERGEVIRPALIWCDQRTDAQCRAITQRIGAERLIELVCNPALTGFTLPKLLWVREVEPDQWRRVRSILLPKDFVRFRLTGERASDVADSSGTLLFDVKNRRWSSEMLAAFEIPETLLPRVFESPEVTGQISAAGAAATGLREGTPVVAGAGDQAAGAVGIGIVEAGTVSATIGTSGVVFAATDRPALDPKGRVHTFCHAIPGRWHVMGVTQGAGLSLRWFRDRFGAGPDDGRDPYERLTEEAAQAPPGADGVLWAPYLMGERTPHLDPHARAALVGLAANHTRAHIIRAILEGVAFSLRDTFEIFREMRVPVERVRLGGGGARSQLWRQIQADIYGYEVETVEAEEGAAYGAAILAGVGVGAWPSVDAACKAVVRVASRTSPDEQTAQVMDRQYAAFRALYPALRSVVSLLTGKQKD
ncbi:xylulokinase [Pyrinomonas methylaliphatogenes]|uniref:Xylulose kinase n=1 Tax=Pyrinomonas methylaliphatogenes TaxID=454194 RepID=A0A0B6WTL2_9BACT|nr:xylulokinase [Pyrinomonas methylaliphatogenes]CDM64381.1 xylulokinase [Pyrinomonas methylaliphatogenes]